MSAHWLICEDSAERVYVRRCYPTQTTEQRSGALIFASRATAMQYLPQVRESLPDAKIVRVTTRKAKPKREALLGLLAECYGELRSVEATATTSDFAMDGLLVLLARVRDALAERSGK